MRPPLSDQVAADAAFFSQQAQPRQHKRQRRGAITPNSQEAVLCAIAAREYLQEAVDQEASELSPFLLFVSWLYSRRAIVVLTQPY